MIIIGIARNAPPLEDRLLLEPQRLDPLDGTRRSPLERRAGPLGRTIPDGGNRPAQMSEPRPGARASGSLDTCLAIGELAALGQHELLVDRAGALLGHHLVELLPVFAHPRVEACAKVRVCHPDKLPSRSARQGPNPHQAGK